MLVRAVRFALRVANTEPYASYLDTTDDDEFFDHKLRDAPDAVIEEALRNRMETLYHPTSTARMAPLSDGGVLDPYLRVHGVEGLRVVDASIFPTIIAGHTVSSPSLYLCSI